MRFRPKIACDDCLAYYPDAYGDFNFVLIIVYFFVLLLVHVVSCDRVFLDLWRVSVQYTIVSRCLLYSGGGGGGRPCVFFPDQPRSFFQHYCLYAKEMFEAHCRYQGHYRIKPLPAHCTVHSPDVGMYAFFLL